MMNLIIRAETPSDEWVVREPFIFRTELIGFGATEIEGALDVALSRLHALCSIYPEGEKQ